MQWALKHSHRKFRDPMALVTSSPIGPTRFEGWFNLVLLSSLYFRIGALPLRRYCRVSSRWPSGTDFKTWPCEGLDVFGAVLKGAHMENHKIGPSRRFGFISSTALKAFWGPIGRQVSTTGSCNLIELRG